MNSSDLYKEDLLVKRYQLLDVIGSGAMGKIYRAEDTISKGQIVAVKILARALDDMKMVERFQREATISALLSERSPNIVKVTDYGVNENKVPFYVMEFLYGENLADVIQIHGISLAKFFEYTRQICLAIETAHNGIFFQQEICPIIHRDLKPTNIFITEDEQGIEQVKVLDFGIAKLEHSKSEQTEHFMGTPRYCSPEQLKGLELDNRSDLYSLGIIMYEMLSKKLPWQLTHGSVGEWYNAHTQMLPNGFEPELNIPIELEQLIMACLSKSRDDRPQSAGEILQKLEGIARNLKIKVNKPASNSSNSQIILNSPEITHQNPTNQPSQEQQLWSELEQFYLNTEWPTNKPQEKIVFPRIMPYENKRLVSLWTMLEAEEIKNRKNNIRYNQFLFQSYPHPMILWITALYSLEHGPRWLPCYLDLKTKLGIQVTKFLSESKEYYLLFFPLNNSSRCQDLVSFKVMLKQKTNLKQWYSLANTLEIRDSSQALFSKRKLKQNFEEIKPKIILDLDKSQTQELHG
jgi:serine/threonine-protein kinase